MPYWGGAILSRILYLGDFAPYPIESESRPIQSGRICPGESYPALASYFQLPCREKKKGHGSGRGTNWQSLGHVRLRELHFGATERFRERMSVVRDTEPRGMRGGSRRRGGVEGERRNLGGKGRRGVTRNTGAVEELMFSRRRSVRFGRALESPGTERVHRERDASGYRTTGQRAGALIGVPGELNRSRWSVERDLLTDPTL